MKKIKRTLCLFLTILMTMGLSVPVYATSTDITDGSQLNSPEAVTDIDLSLLTVDQTKARIPVRILRRKKHTKRRPDWRQNEYKEVRAR